MGVGERGKEEGHMLNMQKKQGKREREDFKTTTNNNPSLAER